MAGLIPSEVLLHLLMLALLFLLFHPHKVAPPPPPNSQIQCWQLPCLRKPRSGRRINKTAPFPIIPIPIIPYHFLRLASPPLHVMTENAAASSITTRFCPRTG
ncbi:hypothetical protein CAOG_009818 [Capsaspora owczarzaki ATCC 30864]|uniref:Secreted protein n=1 Tax=Capsaspora owczarzaki (strain ATCC 30864) TaxID=595528 RepID=A0A0D2X3K2_CAPO3|nr:hypothetical protein CAOG_009818 [Capsaspora owczarzaki ATCC 30864]